MKNYVNVKRLFIKMMIFSNKTVVNKEDDVD